MKALHFICMLFCFQHVAFFPITSTANQIDNLYKLIQSRKSKNPPNSETWAELGSENKDYSPVYVGNQSRLREADKIDSLPGQPQGVDFDQYAGYVTVNATAGRALFYYFVESPKNSLTNPLVLWLNGVANVIFLESPAGVGFSYSNTSSDYAVGDKRTAEDSYTFLVNWLERFHKNRDFYITGESYAGHYVPQLASTILSMNKITNQTVINLKGIAIGNAWVDDNTSNQGIYDYFWTHALNSDETHAGITKNCDFANENTTSTCDIYQNQAYDELGKINIYNIYAPLCNLSAPKTPLPGSVINFDPCSYYYVKNYLNLPEVQKALHARNTTWSSCSDVIIWKDSPSSILPTIKQLIDSGIRLWVYSGDVDGLVPVTCSRYSINTFKLPVMNAWRPWYSSNEVGGYVVEYKGLVLSTVRGAGHEVPSYEPERALTMISSFLQGKLPPSF